MAKSRTWNVRVKEGWMMGIHAFKTKKEALRFWFDWIDLAETPAHGVKDAVSKLEWIPKGS
jgi:hypothetical protein